MGPWRAKFTDILTDIEHSQEIRHPGILLTVMDGLDHRLEQILLLVLLVSATHTHA